MHVHAQSLSHVRLFVAPWTVAHHAPLSVEFSRQEYRSGLPFPSLGDLHNPGMKPASPALTGGFFTTESSGSPMGLLMFSSAFDSTCIVACI